MSSTCRPWYKWFPKDFMADEKVRALSPLAELVYRRILDALWESSECRLPNDIRFLHRVSCKDISYEQFIEVWNEVQYPGFEILKNTEKFVWSKRLKVQFVECVERSEKARKSALAMHSKKANAERTQSERKQNAYADKDIDKDIDKDNIKNIVFFLNDKAGKNFKTGTPKTKQLIKARFKEKFTLKDFYIVIENQCRDWLGTDMDKYLRPETLFGTKFEGYLQNTESNKPKDWKTSF